jgi:hypothetical protein
VGALTSKKQTGDRQLDGFAKAVLAAVGACQKQKRAVEKSVRFVAGSHGV